MAAPARDLELLGAIVGLLEGLWLALKSLLEGLEGLLESLWDLLGSLDGSEGGLLVIREPSWEDLGTPWSALRAS